MPRGLLPGRSESRPALSAGSPQPCRLAGDSRSRIPITGVPVARTDQRERGPAFSFRHCSGLPEQAVGGGGRVALCTVPACTHIEGGKDGGRA
jgi:hypothetical protein